MLFIRWQKYSDRLNTGLVSYSNGRFVSGCQMVRYQNGGLKTGLKKPVNGPNVRYSNGPPMHTTLPFDYQTLTLTRKMDDVLIFHCSLHNIICKSFRLVLMCDVNLGIWANSSQARNCDLCEHDLWLSLSSFYSTQVSEV